MKQPSACAPALRKERIKSPPKLIPAATNVEPQPSGAGLIFENAYGPSSTAADGISRRAQIWNWCEWLRISLVAAALIAAGVPILTTAVMERAEAQSTHLRNPRLATVREVAQRRTEPAVVGAIHYSSDEQATTVSLDLPNVVYFESHRLESPARIYFDLKGTRMPQNLHGRVIQVGVEETFLQKIRVAERGPGVTRLVLETKGSCAYSAMIAPDPYRLIVRLHAPESSTSSAQ